jgi:hypothetical protein
MKGIDQDDVGKSLEVLESGDKFVQNMDGSFHIRGPCGLNGHPLEVRMRGMDRSDRIKIEYGHGSFSYI